MMPETLSNMIVRPAQLEDLEAMVALLQTLFALEKDFTPDPARQRRGLVRFLDGCGKHRVILVAEIDGEVAAMATVQILISTAEGGPVGLVEDVVVRREYRSHGVGRRLMAAVADWGRKRELQRLQLLADRDNAGGRRFYEKIGWRPTQLICLRKMWP